MLNIEEINSIDIAKVGYFRFKKFDNETYLITNDAGKFHFFSIEDFHTFLNGDIEQLTDYKELLLKGFIKNHEYEEKMTGSVALKNHFVGYGPSLHIFVTTLRCNHSCVYCHAAVAPMTAKGFDMDKETAKKSVDTLLYSNSPTVLIEFQGGESLVNYEIVKFVVQYAKDRAQHLGKDLSFSLVTNLTLMTTDKLDWLISQGVDICTSLDGDKLSHNTNRAGYDGDSFDTVSYWIQEINKRYAEINKGKMGALLTVTRENLKNYKRIIDSYVGLGLDSIFLRWLNPYGFAAGKIEKMSYSSDEWVEFYEKSLDYILDLNKQGIFLREHITCVYLQKIFSSLDPAFMDIRSPSGIALGAVAYNYDGKIYASDESRMLGRMGDDTFLLADISEGGENTYISMMQNNLTNIAAQSTTLDGLPAYNDHVYKPYLGVDIIHNYSVSGNIYVPLPKDEKMKIQIKVLDIIFQKLQNPEEKRLLQSWING